jgi:phosphate transport system protein
MPRDTLTRQIHHLLDEVLLLGSMVEQATLSAVDILRQRDLKAAAILYENDQRINDKRFAIENAILILIATQQPMAHDLRLLAAMLEIITELERMGDYAKGIAKVTLHLKDADINIPNRDLERMANQSVNMLHRGLSAFVNEDPNEASAIAGEDAVVDDLYIRIYRHLVEAMIANPVTIDQYNQVMWVAHNLERMADRVTNICERTVFIATGDMLEMDTTDDEESDGE